MPILKFFSYGVKRMANDALICIPILDSRLEFAQRVLLPSLWNSLNTYPGRVQFSVSLVAQNIPPEQLARFNRLPHWHLQHVDKDIAPCPFGDRLGMYQAKCQAALTGYSYYVLADDDFRFSLDAVTRYAAIIEGMEAHPKVGSVMCAGFLGGSKKTEPFTRTLTNRSGRIKG